MHLNLLAAAAAAVLTRFHPYCPIAMIPMTTVSEVLNHLKEEGYTVDFNLRGDCLMGPGYALQLYPNEFLVDKHYRFEGMSDPGDEAVVYAISSARHDVKGTLVNGYGISSQAMGAEMVKALRENPTTRQGSPDTGR